MVSMVNKPSVTSTTIEIPLNELIRRESKKRPRSAPFNECRH